MNQQKHIQGQVTLWGNSLLTSGNIIQMQQHLNSRDIAESNKDGVSLFRDVGRTIWGRGELGVYGHTQLVVHGEGRNLCFDVRTDTHTETLF